MWEYTINTVLSESAQTISNRPEDKRLLAKRLSLLYFAISDCRCSYANLLKNRNYKHYKNWIEDVLKFRASLLNVCESLRITSYQYIVGRESLYEICDIEGLDRRYLSYIEVKFDHEMREFIDRKISESKFNQNTKPEDIPDKYSDDLKRTEISFGKFMRDNFDINDVL